MTDLIAPLVDDGHVDVIDEDRHALAAGRSVRAAHPLVDVALHSALNKGVTTMAGQAPQHNTIKLKRTKIQ